MPQSRLFRLLILALVVMMTIGPAAALQAQEDRVIRIGLNVPLTGPIALIGEGYRWGVTLAIEDLGGEIDGYRLELIEADNKCNPTDTINATRRLVEVDEVHVMIGGGCSSASVAAMPILLESETPMVCGSSTTPRLWAEMGDDANPWFFRVNPDDLIMAQAFSSYIAERASTISLIADNNDFGRGAMGAYKPLLEAAGVTIVSEDYFDPGTADYRPALTRIRAADPEAILMVTLERDGATLMRQIREVGLTQQLFSRGSIVSPLFLELTQDDPTIGEGVLEFSFWASGMDPEQDANFQARWERPNSPHRGMSYYVMYYAVAEAIRNAIASGEVTRASIRDGLAAVDIEETPIGSIRFDDHNQNYPNGTLATIRDGAIQFVDRIPLVPVEGRES